MFIMFFSRRHIAKTDSVDIGAGDSKGNKKPTATRHIILIRHGQYNLKGETDEDRYLTELGLSLAFFITAWSRKYSYCRFEFFTAIRFSYCSETDPYTKYAFW